MQEVWSLNKCTATSRRSAIITQDLDPDVENETTYLIVEEM